MPRPTNCALSVLVIVTIIAAYCSVHAAPKPEPGEKYILKTKNGDHKFIELETEEDLDFGGQVQDKTASGISSHPDTQNDEESELIAEADGNQVHQDEPLNHENKASHKKLEINPDNSETPKKEVDEENNDDNVKEGDVAVEEVKVEENHEGDEENNEEEENKEERDNKEEETNDEVNDEYTEAEVEDIEEEKGTEGEADEEKAEGEDIEGVEDIAEVEDNVEEEKGIGWEDREVEGHEEKMKEENIEGDDNEGEEEDSEKEDHEEGAANEEDKENEDNEDVFGYEDSLDGEEEEEIFELEEKEINGIDGEDYTGHPAIDISDGTEDVDYVFEEEHGHDYAGFTSESQEEVYYLEVAD